MSWSIVARASEGANTTSYTLQPQRTSCIALGNNGDTLLVVDQYSSKLLGGGLRTLARINVAGWGVKLEALSALDIEPANPRSNENITPNQERYTLDSSARTEVIFLRENDKIYFQEASTEAHVTLKYAPSEVQVDSSVGAEVPESVDPGVQPSPADEDETDDEDLDRTVAVPTTSGHRSEATPMPSLSRSEVVQETPTTNRFQQMTTLANGHTAVSDAGDAAAAGADEEAIARPNEEQEGATERETPREVITPFPRVAFSPRRVPPSTSNASAKPEVSDSPVPTRTDFAHNSLFGDGISNGKFTHQSSAQSGSQDSSHKDDDSAEIPVTGSPSKRKLEEFEEDDDHNEDEAESSPPDAKRIKETPSGTQDSTSSKGKKARFSVSSNEVKALKRQQLEQSPVSDVDLDWEDEPPKVAFSNSGAATDNLKSFIRNKGGEVFEDLKDLDKCNILCVRDGPLRKSPKLLACIALGVRVVTDKWLVDSSRKKKFQDPNYYIPKAPKQEKEWGFSLRDVWGQPHQFLKGHTVYFTSALSKTFQDFSEIQQLVRHAGARKVLGSARCAGSGKEGNQVVILGLGDGDVECAALLKGGCTVYNRDIVAASILRGSIDLDNDEFKIKAGRDSSPKRGSSPKVTPTPRKRGRPRKS